MKRGSILLLSSLMLLSLAGLVLVQGYWVRNSVQLKEQEFSRSVNAALNRAVMDLEAQEKVSWIQREMVQGNDMHRLVIINGDTLEASDLPAEGKLPHPMDGPAILQHEEVFIRSDSPSSKSKMVVQVRGNSTVILNDVEERTDSLQVSVMPQAELVEQLLADLARDPKPLDERLDSASLRQSIAEALQQVDIHEPFRLGVSERPGQPLLLPFSAADYQPDTNSAYRVRLFPSSIRKDPAQLVVDFPTHKGSLSQVLRIVLPTTGVLILVIAGVFGFTLSAWRKQKRLSEMKTEFINNMTHELKTPIATISLATEALQDPDMLRDEATLRRYTQMIREENNRLQQHIERALENARLEKGQLVLQPAIVLLQDALQSQMDRIQPRLAARGGRIQLHSYDQVYVKADVHYLHDILHNLIDNAEKYSVDSPQINLQLTTSQGQAYLAITDQGIGIAPEHLARIFDPFYRVPTGNTHDVKGTGLGLSYSKKLARLMGGDLIVTSRPGKGSTFTLRLPMPEKGGVA